VLAGAWLVAGAEPRLAEELLDLAVVVVHGVRVLSAMAQRGHEWIANDPSRVRRPDSYEAVLTACSWWVCWDRPRTGAARSQETRPCSGPRHARASRRGWRSACVSSRRSSKQRRLPNTCSSTSADWTLAGAATSPPSDSSAARRIR